MPNLRSVSRSINPQIQQTMNEPKDLKQQIADLQQQILQSEKLASLGLLSAGITHEIQNPLNFVINFSQMATDLVDDLEELLEEEQIDLDDPAHEELAETLRNLRLYLAKIVSHGHRATDIIQGILRYSRGKEDLFVPTDMAHLLTEYVWLSYHAMRANLPGFNVTIHESYASDLPEVKVIPQDISRAIINLMNNACYAVWKRQSQETDAYQPTISVSARQEGDRLVIVMEDNGVGMSAEVQQKLFTAFFTTKPAGQGTGLGLSITRTIIEHKHRGTIRFESVEQDHTRFTLSIPMNL